MSLISPNHRRDTLELAGDQQAADKDQLREHCSDLFDEGFYLNQLQGILDDLCKFHSSRSLKANLNAEDQKKLNVFTADLNKRIRSAISKTPFEFDVQHASTDLDEDGFEKEHEITVTLSNIGAILDRAAKPLLDLDQLHRLSVFIRHLESQIERNRASLPNFEEHNRRHEVEIEVLKSELGDLEDQEKQGKLTRSERIQKEQLEKEMEKHHQAIAKNSKKLKKKKKQISDYQKKIDQIARQMSEFLSHYDPKCPEFLPKEFRALIAVDNGDALEYTSIQSKMIKILSAKRNGSYSSYNPSLARAKWLEEKKHFLKKWGPRAAAILVLAGGGLYATHEKIKTALAGVNHPLIERILDKDERIALLEKEFEEDMKSDPDELTLMKSHLLKSLESSRASKVSPDMHIDVLAADDWKELADFVIKNASVNPFVSEDHVSFHGLNRVIIQLKSIYGENFELSLKTADREQIVYQSGKTQETTLATFDLRDFYKLNQPPVFIIKRPSEGGEIHEVLAMSSSNYDYSREQAQAMIERGASIKRLKADLLKAQADLLKHPLILTNRELLESWDDFAGKMMEAKNADELGIILGDHISKLEKDPAVIAYVEKIVRSSPHLSFADEGYDVSPENLEKTHDGAHFTTDQAVSGMITLGLDGRFLSEIRRKFGPAAKGEIILMNEDGTPSNDLKFSKPYGSPGSIVVNLALNNVRRQCQVRSGAYIHVDVPFADGMGGFHYAHFKIPMLLSEMHGTNKMDSGEDLLFCEELEAVRVPGFNGSLTRLIKYLNIGSSLYKKVAYAKNAKEIEKYLPEVLEMIKDNPQFKKDLDQALSEVNPKVQLEHYAYPESGSFKRSVFSDLAPLHYGSETLDESGDYIAFGAHPSLISHLEEVFGKKIVDVRLYGIVKEKEFCESDSGVKLEVIIQLTPDHSFSVFYPINLKEEGASVATEHCSEEGNQQESPVVKEIRELIDSVPPLGFGKFVDVFRYQEDDNVRKMKIDFNNQLRRNAELFGEDLANEIMQTYAITGIFRDFSPKLKEKYGKGADVKFIVIDNDENRAYSIHAVRHVHNLNAFRAEHMCSAASESFFEFSIPSKSGEKTTFRIPVSLSSLKAQFGDLFCNYGQSLTKPDLNALTEKLRAKKDKLNKTKVRILDHLGDRLADWQKFEILVEIKSIKDLRRFINDFLPGCEKRIYMKDGRKMIHLKPHPENIKVMQMIYGKGTVTSLHFFVNGNPDGGYEFGERQMELDIEFDKFCDFDNILSLIITRPDKFSPDTLWRAGFYNETCPQKTYEVRDAIDLGRPKK